MHKLVGDLQFRNLRGEGKKHKIISEFPSNLSESFVLHCGYVT